MYFSQVTYIWVDGTKPAPVLRSKVKIVPCHESKLQLKDLPLSAFDGSSTNQADSYRDSDMLLQPICMVNDPILGEGNYLALCEVLNPDGSAHVTNKRIRLVEVLEKYGKSHDPWISFEQEYTLFDGQKFIGWPEGGYLAPKGPFYCGVGAEAVYGRSLVEAHTQACLVAGLMLCGTNAEVMPGQWEFQIGYRGAAGETPDPVTVSDHLWLARWLLYRLGEDVGLTVKLHPKPVAGEWNGSGNHTNFSTRAMRDPNTGMEAINKALKALESRHHEHIAVYGADLTSRLTGRNTTVHIAKFISGIRDRGATIRIPALAFKGYGYLEDRRPGANANPYEVATMLVETICGDV